MDVSEDTIRRHIKRGSLKAELVQRDRGQNSIVEVPVDDPRGWGAARHLVGERERASGLEQLVDDLWRERDAWKAPAMSVEQTVRDLLALLRHTHETSSRHAEEVRAPAHQIQGASVWQLVWP